MSTWGEDVSKEQKEKLSIAAAKRRAELCTTHMEQVINIIDRVPTLRVKPKRHRSLFSSFMALIKDYYDLVDQEMSLGELQYEDQMKASLDEMVQDLQEKYRHKNIE